jgi:hypothetical protein
MRVPLRPYRRRRFLSGRVRVEQSVQASDGAASPRPGSGSTMASKVAPSQSAQIRTPTQSGCLCRTIDPRQQPVVDGDEDLPHGRRASRRGRPRCREGTHEAVGGGGGNRTRVLERSSGASTSVASGGSRLRAPAGRGPFDQPGFDFRRRPPGGAASVSLRATPGPRLQAIRGGRLPN